MFERKKYKQFALTQLKGRWTVPVLITLFISIILEIFAVPVWIQLFHSGYFSAIFSLDSNQMENAVAAVTEAQRTSLLTTVIQTVVSSILDVAAIGVYLKMSRSPEPVKFSDFIEGLNNWARAALGALWELLWVTLWSLLFVIPGIIKGFAYSQMFYIIAEYKEVSVTKAMKISMEITKGHKWDIFVMYLSFLGWAFVCAFTMGIGTLWLTPYMDMTFINAYHAMMKEAIESGRIKPEDLAE